MRPGVRQAAKTPHQNTRDRSHGSTRAANARIRRLPSVLPASRIGRHEMDSQTHHGPCLGRLLKPAETSQPCYPSIAKTVKRTHNAPIEFQRAPNTFLPAGFRLDGDGVLHFEGRFEYKPKRGDLRFCAIQLKASSCDKGKFAELVLDQSFPWWADISAAGA